MKKGEIVRVPKQVRDSGAKGGAYAGEMTVEERRERVASLSLEGLSSREIGEELGISPRTVERDRAEVRRANSMSRDQKLVEEQLGGLIVQSQRAISRMRRMANDRETPAAVRLDAEWKAWLACDGLAERLQKRGSLPSAAKEVRADVTHRVERQSTAAEMNARVAEFEKIVRDAGRMDEVAEKQFARLKESASRAEPAEGAG